MIVITTPTGQIGHDTALRLVQAGQPVRVIARDPARLDPALRDRVEVTDGSHGDRAVLDRALAGADALLWLVPPDFRAAGAREHYLDFTRPAVEAIATHHVGHVVGISSAGHDWAREAGLLSAAFAMDEALSAGAAAYRALSMPGFMENLLRDVARLRDGVLAQSYAPDRVMPLVATRDIAAVAAGLLAQRDWAGHENLPVFGPDRLTMAEQARVIGDALGREITYTQVPLSAIAEGMRARGSSPGFVDDMVAMLAAQDDGIYAADLARARPTATDLRTWCEEVLAPVVRGA